MKKVLLSAMLTAALIFTAACGSAPAPAVNNDSSSNAASGALKTGFAVISSVEKSKDAGDEDGLAQTDSNAIGVLVDENGVIVKCVIDAAQTKINFSKEGKLLTPLDTIVPTKKEMGTDYGLSKESSLGTDWGDQIEAFASYVEGKTLEEVKGISVDETTAPTDEELTSSVTIKIGGYIAGLEKAVANAADCGAKAGDTLGLGIATNVSKSKDAVADADGVAQAYSIYTLSSFDKDGKITSCIIDGSQCNVNFNVTGMITSDLAGPLQSKNELGDAYGLKVKSGIGKEWNEQAASFAEYAIGKTVEDLSSIAVTAEGAPTDADLTTSVTIKVGDFNTCLKKAFDTSK